MLKLYNALTGQLEEFAPVRPGEVRMYVCGLTVSDDAHLGHGRSAAVFDLLRRFLVYLGYRVIYVRNITDVDDKIVARARLLELEPRALAEKYIERQAEDLERLRVPRADIEPRASEHIQRMVEFIDSLVVRGMAYEENGSVYFKLGGAVEFGRLARHAKIEPERENFLLWRRAEPTEISWPSPWGQGRPGWHIECSAMAREYLGDVFDIHGGGEDLLHPHHDAEIAQSAALAGAPPARFFLHNAMVNIADEKMSKSSGHFFALRELFGRYDPAVVRHYLFNTHYRAPIEFRADALEESRHYVERIERFRRAAADVTESTARSITEEGRDLSEFVKNARSRVIGALENDLDTPLALDVMDGLISAGEKYLQSPLPDPMVLGKIEEFLDELDEIFDLAPDSRTSSREGELVDAILSVRRKLAASGSPEASKAAAAISNSLKSVGIELIDTPWGTRWRWE